MPWRVEDIDFSAVEPWRVRNDEQLFFLLTSASFVESGAALYTRNLIEFYGDYPEASSWLVDHWEREEMQHGRALRAYVEAVWPEFEWQSAFDGFHRDYGAACTLEEFEPTPTLELAARCVVETGTATYYRMLYDAAPEPLLRRILDNIRRDELRHFKYFFRFFRAHSTRDQASRRGVLKAVARRAYEAMQDDGYCAFRHVYATRYPRGGDSASAYRAFRRDVHRLAREHYPHRMAAEMLLTPLKLPRLMRRPAAHALAWGLSLAL